MKNLKMAKTYLTLAAVLGATSLYAKIRDKSMSEAKDQRKQEVRADQVEKFQAAVDKKMAVINTKLSKLETKIGSMTGEAKESMSDAYEELVEMRDKASEQYEEVKTASVNQWDDTKDKLNEYIDLIENKIDEVGQG